jgi:hypothetical protein
VTEWRGVSYAADCRREAGGEVGQDQRKTNKHINTQKKPINNKTSILLREARVGHINTHKKKKKKYKKFKEEGVGGSGGGGG